MEQRFGNVIKLGTKACIRFCRGGDFDGKIYVYRFTYVFLRKGVYKKIDLRLEFVQKKEIKKCTFYTGELNSKGEPEGHGFLSLMNGTFC